MTITALKKRLWKVFSLYIRLRDADDRGYCKCITCGKRHHYTNIDAGHFIPKSAGNAIYFDEENVNAQCRSCNSFHSGEQYKYGLAIDDKFGDGTAKKLLKKSTQTKKFTQQELLDMIDYYKQAIKDIKKAKNL